MRATQLIVSYYRYFHLRFTIYDLRGFGWKARYDMALQGPASANATTRQADKYGFKYNSPSPQPSPAGSTRVWRENSRQMA